jgi:biopolymer transport protein ExbD
MSRFRRQRREVPGLNMAAMPDLIFTVLFFFMIVTHMRDVSPKVSYEVPQGTELEKVGRKAGVVYLFIGKPIDAQGNVLSGETRIQLNDRYVEVEEIGAAIAQERARLPQGEHQLTVNIRADRDTEMGLVNDVKLQLRKAGALQINYSATSKGERVKR